MHGRRAMRARSIPNASTTDFNQSRACDLMAVSYDMHDLGGYPSLAQTAGCSLVLFCRRRTFQHSIATGTPMRDVAIKNHSKPRLSMMKPEAPASRLPGRAQSDVRSAYWLAACSVAVSEDM